MNILYGVPGEGMGHATRSKVVVEYLLSRGHDVQVVSSARAFQYLSKAFPGRVHEIKGLHFAFKNSQVSKLGTFLLNVKSAPASLLHNFNQYLEINKRFTPDVVISDFESFTNFYAKRYKLPLISIDNIQMIDRCKLDIEIPKEEKNNYLLAKSIVSAKVPGAKHYLITSFFEAETKKKNTTIVPPIVRKAIEEATPKQGDHILVYQTSSSQTGIVEALHKVPDLKFFVYGFNKDERNKNVVIKSFSENGFVKDLAGAMAVIANGGFSFISEAVYLQKSVYSFPLINQFEQFMNAAFIDKMGYGRHFKDLNADSLKAFLYDLPVFQKNLKNVKQNGNAVLFKELEKVLKALP